MVWPCVPPAVCPDWCCLCISCSTNMLGGGLRGEQQRNRVCPWHLRSKTIDIASIPMRKVAKMGSFHYFLLWSLQPSVLSRQTEAQRLKAFAQSHRAQEARIQNTRCFWLFSIISLPKEFYLFACFCLTWWSQDWSQGWSGMGTVIAYDKCI